MAHPSTNYYYYHTGVSSHDEHCKLIQQQEPDITLWSHSLGGVGLMEEIPMSKSNKSADREQSTSENDGQTDAETRKRIRHLTQWSVFHVLKDSGERHAGKTFRTVKKYDDASNCYPSKQTVDGKFTGNIVHFNADKVHDARICEIVPRRRGRKSIDILRLPTPELPDTRPEIEITTEAHTVRDQATAALTRDVRIFSRGDVLTMVITPQKDILALGQGVKLHNAENASIMAPIDDANMRCLLSENAQLYYMIKDKHDIEHSKDCLAPGWLIDAILAAKMWPGIRELLTLTECPYLREDGTIAYEAGYDPGTRTLFIPRFTLPPIGDHLTKEDAQQAVARLLDPLGQFPFNSPEDKFVWLTGLLTAVQRPVIMGPVPGFAFIGNKAGCGKELLINLIGQLVFGGNIPTSPYPTDKDESDKVALALALCGVQAVHFDNLNEGSSYGNAGIDSALTSRTRDGRVLGSNRYAKQVPIRPWWALSGNNISPGHDAFRRWLPVNLETDLESPHERDDLKIVKLEDHFRNNRPEFVRDALIILKAHSDCGGPGHGMGPLGSFVDWDDAVRAPAYFATGLDCLETQRQATKDSPEYVRKLMLLETLYELGAVNTNGFTCAEILNMADYFMHDKQGGLSQYPALRNTLMEFSKDGKLPTANFMGYFMRGIAKTRYGNYRLEKVLDDEKTVRRWRVVKIN
jgi:hypothetical protein